MKLIASLIVLAILLPLCAAGELAVLLLYFNQDWYHDKTWPFWVALFAIATEAIVYLSSAGNFKGENYPYFHKRMYVGSLFFFGFSIYFYETFGDFPFPALLCVVGMMYWYVGNAFNPRRL